jgi:iron complex outermembrane receptor protein
MTATRLDQTALQDCNVTAPWTRLLTATCGLSMLLGAGLLAPGYANAAETEEAAELDEVTVVGSRIRRDTFNSPSPVTIVTREDSVSAGFASTTDVLQSSSLSSGASQINNAYGGFVTDGGPGANTLSLRGLGASRTLVLINGRRVAPAGTRGAIGSADLNVLPSAMVDRIEILKDGASSIYGSDAVAGVVNVITRKNAQGLTIEGQYNRPFDEGGETGRASLVAGMTSDRWNVSGSIEYLTRSDLKLKDRDWASCNSDYFFDPDTGESLDYIDPLTGKPKCYTITGTGSNGVTINTIGTPATGGRPAIGNPTQTGVYNRWRPNSGVAAAPGILGGYEGVSGASLNVRDTFEPRMLEESLISPVEIWTGYVQGGYDLQALGNAELYGELLVHNRGSEQTGYRQLSIDYPVGSPLIPANLVFPSAFLGGQPNTGGVPVGIRAFVGFGNDTNSQELDFLKPTVGIRGDLPFGGWRYDAYTTFSKSDASYTFESFLTDRLAYASNAVASPVGLNPALNYNGYTCAINLTNPAEACVPNPPLNSQTIGGNLPQSFKDYIFRPVTGNTEYQEWVTSAVIDGPLYELPYGSLQGVFGIEHRRVKINDQPDPNSVAGNLFNLTSAAPTVGKDNVTELFAEIEAPLLADMPFVKELTFNGSARYTDYNSYGSDSTWKLGLVYSPVSWMSLRSTAGTSYRAPALFEQFQGATTGFLSNQNDPCNNWGSRPAGSPRRANCSSVIPGDPAFLATSGITVYSEGGAAAGLEAETSDSLTVGIILEPTFGRFGNMSLAVDFFDTRVDNQVEQLGAANIMRLCYDDPTFDPTAGYCRLITRDGPGNAYRLFVSNAYVNIASQVARGFDYTLRYEKDIGTGTLVFRTEATNFRKQASKLFADEDLDDVNGNIQAPKWAGFVDATYTQGAWRYRYGFEFLGKQDSETYYDVVDSEYDFHIGTYLTHFASMRYKLKDWEVTAGVRNLYNKEPPKISTAVYNRVGESPLYSGFDYFGRTAFLNIAKSF